MIIAVPIMWMVQVRPDGVIHVVAVWNVLVSAAGAVGVAAGVLGTPVRGRARRRIGRPYCQPMLVHVVTVNIVQMAVVHVVRVTFVLDGRVAAAAAVRVTVLGMGLAWHVPPSRWNRGRLVVGVSGAFGSMNSRRRAAVEVS